MKKMFTQMLVVTGITSGAVPRLMQTLYTYASNMVRCESTNYLAMDFGKEYAIGQSKGSIWQQACHEGDDYKPEGFPWNSFRPLASN